MSTIYGRAKELVNVLLFSAADRIKDNAIAVRDERLTHLLNVHRAAVGDTVRVGEINGLMGQAQIIKIDQSGATLTFSLSEQPPAKLPVRLVLALPRPKMLRRIIRSVAEFGVPHLHLIHSNRVEKSYWQTPVLEDATIERYLIDGLQQARDTRLPSVSCHRLFKPFVEDQLPAIIAGKRAIVFHPDESTTDNHAIKTPAAALETVLVIGPEGGFIPYEIEHLKSAGCMQMTLGSRILRVENAVSTVLGHYLTPPLNLST